MPDFTIGPVSAARFHIYANRAQLHLKEPLKFNLTRYTEAQYANMSTYLSDDNIGGFAVDSDGTLINLFSFGKGRGDRLLAAAIERGARKLDCYDGYLPTLYARHGFVEVFRDKWDDQYAPEGWSKKHFGTPDVVYMERP